MRFVPRLICLLLFVPALVQAQPSTNPPQTAENLRQSLFNAQVALMSDDPSTALKAVDEAAALYQSGLHDTIADVVPEQAAELQAAFLDARDIVADGHVPMLAALRSQIWTGVLRASSEVVFAAIAEENVTQASTWLPLRDFRTSTRFSRPGADATLALRALRDGEMTPADALAAVRADLLDTYQAQLMVSLADADEAQTKGFTLRQAEEAGLAAGYFAILAAPYGEQRGDAVLGDMQANFDALIATAASGDEAGFREARAQIDEGLSGFRAAPLSEKELARRAGQLVRFLTLIPIEYERGVRDGMVTNDIEIQEARTFHQGAASAFADLQATLVEYDAEAAAQAGALLAQVQTQIRDVADPAAVRGTVDEINQLLTATLPESWLNASADSDIDVILSVLDQIATAVTQGEYAQAESSRLEAYALMELGVEQRLRGFAPDMAVYIESLFWQGTNEVTGLSVLLGTQAPVEAVRATLTELESSLDEARLTLESARSAPAAVTGNAAVIVFREGLEAVLILASLMASLRAAEERQYRRLLALGGVLALVASGVTWWLANRLLMQLLPLGETLEAIVSLIAIVVLLLITNWFFHQVYWTGWMANFHARKRRLIGGVTISIGQAAGLVILGFTSIYREGFETVLFLQSLVLEAGIPVVLQGVLLGLLGTAVVGVLTFMLQMRLPYKKMLVVTGVMIGVVLLTMVGNTVHVMQSLGWLPITPIRGLFIPYALGQWFGLFATWEGIILQAVSVAFVVGSYFLAEHRSKQKRQRARQTTESPVAVSKQV
ncbi:MAG: iron permease [Anaerolineaceae bacterium]|nr:iron permease [Anaerolineaceae bacterium]